MSQVGTNKEWKFFRVFCITKSWFLVLLLSIAWFIQGFVVNGLIKITISPLQKRFRLTSRDMGFVASSYDITSLIAILPLTYLCSTGHKPLVIGVSFVLFGFGCLLYALPHFLDEPYSNWVSLGGDEVNVVGSCSSDDCSNSTSAVVGKSMYYGFFVAAQALNGIGASAVRTLGTVYIDENLSQKGSPMALGFFQTTGQSFGPAVGFIGGGALLKLWVDGSDRLPAEIRPDLWIGNWWLGFVVAGLLAIIVGVLIVGLPRELTDAKRNQSRRRNEQQAGQMDKIHAKSGTIRDAHKSTFTLLCNYPFLMMIMAMAFEAGFRAVIVTYSAKYLEEMFGMSTSNAAMIFGLSTISAALVGQVCGGLWVGKTNPTLLKQMWFCTWATLISLFCCFTIFYSCDETPFVGGNLSYSKSISGYANSTYTNADLDLPSHFRNENFNDECFNSNSTDPDSCQCDLSNYQPLCVNDLTYYSTCYAGCNSANISEIEKCSCVPPAPSLSVSSGRCKEKSGCKSSVYLGLTFFLVFFTFVHGAPATNCILRVVPPELRSHAMGINIIFLRLIGRIPAPVIVGELFDRACSFWQTTCGVQGSCRIYNRHELMLYWLGAHLVFKLLSLLCWGVAILTYKPVAETTIDEDEEVDSSRQ